ncbi:hypothetical protein ACFRH4_39285 [Streptomyces mirabilis]|uniref:hypothetical protein n=1 Tax=Streptomyces mirabilis TaxID=68239 RepID=UPI0036967A1F
MPPAVAASALAVAAAAAAPAAAVADRAQQLNGSPPVATGNTPASWPCEVLACPRPPGLAASARDAGNLVRMVPVARAAGLAARCPGSRQIPGTRRGPGRTRHPRCPCYSFRGAGGQARVPATLARSPRRVPAAP